METIQEKLERLIRRQLPDARVDLEVLGSGEISGDVISGEFRGRTYAERRARVGAALVEGLTPEELNAIGVILTYTPEEWAVPVD